MSAKDSSSTVVKAVELLRAVGRSRGGVSLTELVMLTSMPKTVCHRLLQTLLSQGLLDRSPETGLYGIGFGLIELAGSALGRNALRNQAARPLAELARVTGDAAMLFIPYGSYAMCIDRMDGDYPVKAAGVEIGGLLPIHGGGAPFAILSHLPTDQSEALLGQPLPPATSRTDMDPASIRRRAAEVRQRGYAVGDEDAIEFVIAIGAPVFGQDEQVIGAVSVGGIRQRYDDDRIAEVAAIVCRAAREISSRLGHIRPAAAGVRQLAGSG